MPKLELPITDRVIREIAKTTRHAVVELPPLYEAIDPEALDTLINTMSNGTVSFTYMKHEVTVRDDGSINVDPISDTPG